jgi:hypothetical protein
MRALTSSEKRTVRYAVIGVSAYLVLFFGWSLSGSLQKRTAAYGQLVDKAKQLQAQLAPYADHRIADAKLMMEHYQLDPTKLKRATVVGEASKQIQQTAASSGIQVGPIRESPTKNAAREMATLQFEGSGPIPGILGLLKRLETLGYPLVVDSVQLTPDPMRPGQIKLIMTLVILDFDQWKMEGKPHA